MWAELDEGFVRKVLNIDPATCVKMSTGRCKLVRSCGLSSEGNLSIISLFNNSDVGELTVLYASCIIFEKVVFDVNVFGIWQW